MDITINPRKLCGTIQAIPSKSQAHRLLICAAFSDGPTQLVCPETNRDIEATVDCLNAIGARIQRSKDGYCIEPVTEIPQYAALNCAESGSTLRFMLPIVGALGIDSILKTEGRLSQRPLSPLWEEMEKNGCVLSRPEQTTIRCQGVLKAGHYIIDGGISSQFITGLLFALSLLKEDSTIEIKGKLESAPYVTMTQEAMQAFGVLSEDFIIRGNQTYHSPGILQVEGDWSNAAFFLIAEALGNKINLTGLNPNSTQGDRQISELLPLLKQHQIINAANIPDLIPILSLYAAANQGSTFTDINRLRLKESDRVKSVVQLLDALGIHSESNKNSLTIYPGKLHGGIVDSANDHRIAMTAAIAATISDGPVTVLDAQCVSKSYPKFWDEYSRLGGCYEQYIR